MSFFGDGKFIDLLAGGKADVLDLFGNQGEDEATEASLAAEGELATATDKAIAEARRSSAEGQEFLAPFGGVGLQGVEQAGFLTDPQAQFDFLQNNPLFQASLDNANRQTSQFAAARGRLSAGDTLTRLSENTLLAAQPLIASQKQSITDLLGFGSGISRAQANTSLGLGSDLSNLFQSQGNVAAQGIQSRNQIGQQTTQNQQQLAGQALAFFSDPRLKDNAVKVGKNNGYDIYQWEWNKEAYDKLGLRGKMKGVMATDVQDKQPDAIVFEQGYMKVNYEMIGVNHGY